NGTLARTSSGTAPFSAQTLTLTNIQNVNLTGGAGQDVFTVNSWNSNANMTGVSGRNTFNMTLTGNGNGNYNVTDTASVSSEVLNATVDATIILTSKLHRVLGQH